MGVFLTYRPSVSGAQSTGLKHDWSVKKTGREVECAQLDALLVSREYPLFVIHGAMGMGKTTLLRTWVQQLNVDENVVIEACYGWRFGSELPTDPQNLAALEQLSRWLLGPQSTNVSAERKIDLLANYLAKHPVLLLFDQVPSNVLLPCSNLPMAMDWLYHLLKRLDQANAGLCLLISDTCLENKLPAYPNAGLMPLSPLPSDVAKSLLQQQGVRADEETLDNILEQFDAHPLSLRLLAYYLKKYHRGDPAGLQLLPLLTDEEAPARHTRRVLAAFTEELEGSAELAVLYLMSFARQSCLPQLVKECTEHLALHCKGTVKSHSSKRWLPFRRPVYIHEEQIEVPKPSFPEWLKPIRGAGVRKLRGLHQQLSQRGLIADEAAEDSFELHPLVREYFFNELKRRHGMDWKPIYQLLYERYKRILSLLPFSEVVTINPFTRKYMPVAIDVLHDSLQKSLTAKDWLEALRWSAQLSSAYVNQGETEEAVACLRQCAAYARLGGDNVALQQSLERLEELMQQKALPAY